jgi:hypothetical protein
VAWSGLSGMNAGRRRAHGASPALGLPKSQLVSSVISAPGTIVPTLRVVTQRMTLRVILDAERPGRDSHAERGNDQEIATAGLLQGCVSSRNLKAGHQSLWETPELCDGSEAVGLVAHLLNDPPPRCRRDLRRLPQGSRKTSRAAFAFDFASKYATVQTTPIATWVQAERRWRGVGRAAWLPREPPFGHGWPVGGGPTERRLRSACQVAIGVVLTISA